MTKFYKKLNFENSLIFLNIPQILILEMVLLSSFDIFFELFFLTQIFNISLIIRKFQILSSQNEGFFNHNILFIFLNILNIILFFVFPIFLSFEFNDNKHLIFRVIYRIFHVFVSLLLAHYCIIFNKMIKNYKNDEDKSYFYLYSNEGDSEVIKRFSNFLSFNNEDDNNNKNDKKEKQKSNSANTNSIFYTKKKRQILYLCILNLI